MKNPLKNFTFPYATFVLTFSALMIFLPVFLSPVLEKFLFTNPEVFRFFLLIPSLLATLGFIYCTLGYHVKITKGDELKFRIHLEALHVAFTSTLITLFILIFLFLNFYPKMLNWILAIISVVAIIVYVVAVEIIKEKYQ